MTETKKKYAVVVDVSPSEQLSPSEPGDARRVMAMLFGLKSPKSLDMVGKNNPDPSNKIHLKKWSKSGRKYRQSFVEHARKLADSGYLMFGCNLSTVKEIRSTGLEYVPLVWPEAGNIILKPHPDGKPYADLTGILINGKPAESFPLTLDEICILGWYAEALVGVCGSLSQINEEEVKLDVLIDRMPNEKGGNDNYKAVLLKELCRRGSNGLVTIVGVPDKPDTNFRDLFVDNLAGMMKHVIEHENSPYREDALSIIRFRRGIP